MPMIRHFSGLKAYGKIRLGLDAFLGRERMETMKVRIIMQTVGLYDEIDLYLERYAGDYRRDEFILLR